GQPDALALIGAPELLDAPVHGPLLRHREALALALLQRLLRRLLLLRKLDLVTLGEPPDRLDIAQVLMLLQEGDRVACFAATETLEDAEVGTDVEAGCLLVVERAESQVTRALPLERDEIAHDLLHAHGVLHLLDGGGGDQG